MKDKHISITEDSALLKQIYAAVHQLLHTDKQTTARLLWTKAIVYIVLAVVTYFLIYAAGTIVMLIISYIAFGLTTVLLGFNFAHDFSHDTIFKNRKLNNLCFTLLYTLLGAHAEAWKFRHINSHHYAPNVKDYDSDLQITSLIRVEPGSKYKWFHRYQHYYAPLAYTTYSLYWVAIKDFVIYFSNEDASYKKKRVFHISFWLQKCFYITYLLILPLLFARVAWLAILFAFLAMHLVQSLFLLFTFFMTHHVTSTQYFDTDGEGYIKTSWVNNQIRSSNDFYPFSRLANFIFGGFNNHIAHHLFPHIPHVYYPQLNRILYKILLRHQIRPNVTTYMGGIVAHLQHLKNMSVNQLNTS